MHRIALRVVPARADTLVERSSVCLKVFGKPRGPNAVHLRQAFHDQLVARVGHGVHIDDSVIFKFWPDGDENVEIVALCQAGQLLQPVGHIVVTNRPLVPGHRVVLGCEVKTGSTSGRTDETSGNAETEN